MYTAVPISSLYSTRKTNEEAIVSAGEFDVGLERGDPTTLLVDGSVANARQGGSRLHLNGEIRRQVASKNPRECRSITLTAAQVFELYSARVYNLARWFASNRCDAEDIAQEVFLQVVRKLATFRGESEFTTWLHRITINAALGHRRKRGCRRTLSAIGPLEHFVDRGRHVLRHRVCTQPHHQAQNRELKREIDQAISRLPKIYRQIFRMADVNKLPLADVADLLNVKLGAAKSRLYRARRLLRRYLTHYLRDC
jgi:RNA polymerase sigma-70 factor (ECF subfamily)